MQFSFFSALILGCEMRTFFERTKFGVEKDERSKIRKITSFSGFSLNIQCQSLVDIFPSFYKMQGSFPRCREFLQNFPCRFPDFSMFYQKLASIFFMCLQNFTALSTRGKPPTEPLTAFQFGFEFGSFLSLNNTSFNVSIFEVKRNIG